MAVIHGKNGTVTFWAGEVDAVTSWSLNMTATTADSTAMADTWQGFKAGFLGWTATVECITNTSVDLDGIGDEGVTLVLTDGTVSYTSTTAICVGLSVTLDKDDVKKHTYEFIGAGSMAVV